MKKNKCEVCGLTGHEMKNHKEKFGMPLCFKCGERLWLNSSSNYWECRRCSK